MTHDVTHHGCRATTAAVLCCLLSACGSGSGGGVSLQSITVSPGTPSVAKGLTEHFVATAKYSDGSTNDVTNTVTWTSSAPAIATVAAGLATAVTTGSVTITAQSGATSGTASLTVTPAALLSVVVSPVVGRSGVNQARQMTAVGYYTDSTTANLTSIATWAAGQPSIATIDAAGKVSAQALGTTPISATYQGVVGTGAFSVVVPKFAYVVNPEVNTILQYAIDPQNGSLTVATTAAAGTGPITISIDPTGRFAYVGNESDTVSSYAIDQGTGALTAVGTAVQTPAVPVAIAADPAGRFLYVADGDDYTIFSAVPDSLQVFAIDQGTGALSKVTSGGGGTAYSLAIDPSGRFAYQGFIGPHGKGIPTWAVAQYSIGLGGQVTSGPLAPIPYSYNGYQFSADAVDPSGRFLFVTDATGNQIFALAIDPASGALAVVGSPQPTGTSPSAVVVEPNGRFVYVADIGSNNVSTYAIDPATGALTPAGAAVAAGTSPIAAAVDPTGSYLYVSNSGANGVNGSVSVFAIDPTTGALTAQGAPVAAGGGTAFGIAVY